MGRKCWDSKFKNVEAYNCKNIIFSSSATVYGDKGLDIIKETCEINQRILKADQGKVEELLLRNIKAQENGKINLRYFNPIGAHKSYLLGEDSKHNFKIYSRIM